MSAASDGWNTVGAALLALFPEGTNFTNKEGQEGLRDFPRWPPDLFAAVAYLLDRGGVYHRIVPEAAPKPAWEPVNIEVPFRDVQEWVSHGNKWCAALPKRDSVLETTDEIEGIIQAYWKKLIDRFDDKIVFRPTKEEEDKFQPMKLEWWEPAFALLVIADEACAGLGFVSDKGSRHFCDEQLREVTHEPRRLLRKIDDDDRHCFYVNKINTFQYAVHASVTRVVPKSQTPFVGCTMRTLSHNVAMVPPQGVVDISWCADVESPADGTGPLNVLLIPFPYVIPATSFGPAGIGVVDDEAARRPPANPWGWFDAEQKWLDKRPGYEAGFSQFILNMIEAAKEDCGQVHAVILPEYAVNWDIYKELVLALRDQTTVEFLIAGSSSGLSPYQINGQHVEVRGNLALTTTFGNAPRTAYTHSRAKHHRWQLNAPQIATYALGSALDPSRVWWERMELPRREVGVTTFRRDNTFATMICEDLARSDPVHEPLRAIGPNIVFVILMDGAQLPHRWPARYTLMLSDDPGSSILTLTSLGLIERSNATGLHREKSRAVSIWKDISLTSPICLECPASAHGILLTTSPEPTSEATLDGRVNLNGKAWRYRGHQPVTLRKKDGFEWVFGASR